MCVSRRALLFVDEVSARADTTRLVSEGSVVSEGICSASSDVRTGVENGVKVGE